MKTINNSPGSFYVGQNLPEQYKRIGPVENSNLALLIQGENAPRKVTFVMGSPNKGWYLTAKGSGPLPANREVEYDIIEERARVVQDEDVTEAPPSRH